MAKILLFSDIHIHNHKKSYERLDDCIKSFEWVFDVARENKINSIVFGGDLLHERQKIDSCVYQNIYNVLKKNQDFDLYLLLGNHDIWFNEKTDVSGVYPFESMERIRVIGNPETIQIEDSLWDFLPFTHDPVESLKKFDLSNIDKKFLIGHISIDGAILNSGGQMSDVIIEHDGEMVKVSKDLFSNYKHAFFGHYHKAQKLAKNVEYIGSPLELSFGESGETKHLIIFDTNTLKHKYIVNNFSPKHIYVHQDSIEDVSKETIDNNFICVLSDDLATTDTKEKINFIREKFSPKSLQFKKNNSKKTQNEDKKKIDDVKFVINDDGKMIEIYIEKYNSRNLDCAILKQIGSSILERAHEVDE